MSFDNLLGTEKAALENLGPSPYTSVTLQNRVLGDIFKENNSPQILVISKLLFHYLNCSSKDVIGMFKQN